MTVAATAATERRAFMNAALLAMATFGVAASGVTVWVVEESPVLRSPMSTAVVRGLFVASYVAVGAYTWWRRPDSRLGPLVAGAGFFYALTSFNASGNPGAHTLGRVTTAALLVYLAYVFLCFPYDRLQSDLERRFMALFALATVLLWTLALTLMRELPVGGAFADCGSSCPDNPIAVAGVSHSLSDFVGYVVTGITALALGVVAVLLLYKIRSPARLRRRAIAPLLYSVIALALSYGTFTVLGEVGVDRTGSLRGLTAASALAIPLALFVGQVWGRVFAAKRLGEFVARVGYEPVNEAQVEILIREALGDPELRLALWRPEDSRYVDVQGAPVELPTDLIERAVTRVTRNGRPVAALIHDASLDVEPGVVEGLAATSLMLLENTRLLEELRSSRARIVATAQREQLRLERNLHDGAQQRLMSLQIKLAQARERAGHGDLGTRLDEISEDASAAVAELRVLAHGIYPTVLRERGLADGLGSLADGAPLAVQVVDYGIGRCTPTVEAAVYFCVLEAIQNAIKHGGAGTRITVTLKPLGDEIEFAVADDGVGFEPEAQAPRFGLVSMHDRIGSIDGMLEVISAPGQGTLVRGTVPVEGVRATG